MTHGTRRGRHARTPISLTLVAVLLGPLLLTAPIAAQPRETPFEDHLVNFIDMLGWDAPLGVTRALDRGYSGTQVVAAVAAGGFDADGALTISERDDTPLTPSLPPAGIVADDRGAGGGGGGDVGADDLLRAIRKHAAQALRDQGVASAGRDDRQGVAFVLIMRAAIAGYSAEQIILDGLLATDGGFAPVARGDGNELVVEIVDADGNVITPEHTVVTPKNTVDALGDLFDGFVSGGGKREGGEESDEEVTAMYTGRLSGEFVDQWVRLNHPDATAPLENAVSISRTEDALHFAFTLAVRYAWVEDAVTDEVTCEARHELFAGITPEPVVALDTNGRFESGPLTVSPAASDFRGPRCAEFPYDGDEDDVTPGVVLSGRVRGRTVSGQLTVEGTTIDFEATRTKRCPECPLQLLEPPRRAAP